MPNADEGAPQDSKPITKEDVAALIAEVLPQTVNAAVTSHTKRLEKSLGETFGKQFTALTESIAKLQPASPSGEPQQPTEKKPDPQLALASKQLEEVTKRLEVSEKRNLEIETAKRRGDASKALTEALTGKVKPGTEALIAKLLTHDGALDTDEDGTPVLKLMAAPYQGAKPELTPFAIADGVAQFLKTDMAAHFIDAPNGGGSGAPRKPGLLQSRSKSPEEMSNVDLVAEAQRLAGIS